MKCRGVVFTSVRCRRVRVVVWYMRCEGVRCGVVKFICLLYGAPLIFFSNFTR